LGTPEQFAALRGFLRDSGYSQDAVRERMGIAALSESLTMQAGAPADDLVEMLIHLFLLGARVDAARWVPAPVLAVMLELGLVEAAEAGFAATVELYPVGGLHIISDRNRGPELPAGEDKVFSAITPQTEDFLAMLPHTNCPALLELCAGAGVAALAAASEYAAHAFAYDLSERSTCFAEFNRRLNGIANFTASQGDLYEPAGELTFDRIVAHPPYVPVYRPSLIFDSGGQDGEQIVRRIIEGLPRYLRPSGRFYALTMGSDREHPFEQRLREWLGHAESEFDVAFINRLTRTPREWAAESVISKKGSVSDIADWRAFFESLHVSALVYGLVMIQRRAQNRPIFTVRRQISSQTGPPEHARLFEWETALVTHEPAWIMELRPRAAPDARFHVEHRLGDGEWVPDSYRLETDHPFASGLRAQAWTAHLLACADGSMTAAELLERLKSDGALHSETPTGAFAEMLATLISGGFLAV
jgi:SAM-dependent methyltransferase